MQHMGVDHRRVDVAMAQQLLNGANVGAAFEPVRGEGVLEGVAGGESQPIFTPSLASAGRDARRGVDVAPKKA
jgi:hypothetical protein